MKEVPGHYERYSVAVQYGKRFDMGRYGMVSVEDSYTFIRRALLRRS